MFTQALTNPRRLFAILAKAEAVTWTLLLVGMFLKYVTKTTDLGVRVFGLFHGLVFLAYCLAVLAIWIDHRWSAKRGLLALASAIPPWATLLFERWVERQGDPQPQWYLLNDPARAKSPLEKVVLAAQRRPALAALAGVLAVVILTSILLIIGPPVPGK